MYVVPRFLVAIIVLYGADGTSNNGSGKQPDGREECRLWQEMAFPSYLQSAVDDFCIEWDESLQAEERKRSQQSRMASNPETAKPPVSQDNPVWQAIRKEAAADAKIEPLLSSFLYASILSHDSFAHSLAFVLANRLSDPTMLATELFEVFLGVLEKHPEVEQAALADTIAVRERDPACTCYSGALLYFKGYHAIQAHRISHALWNRGQTLMARALQSRMSEVFGVDVHPAARIGKGILLDHGIGVVIGETAVIGNNVSLMQHVTLGGTGKEQGDRHPKISDNVLIGASATVLGNITVGKGAQVAANSLVLKSVPPRTMVAGSPAKEVGKVTGNPALKMQHWLKKFEGQDDNFCNTWEGAVRNKHIVDGAMEQGALGSSGGSDIPAQPIPARQDADWATQGTSAATGRGADDNGRAQPDGLDVIRGASRLVQSNGASEHASQQLAQAHRPPAMATASAKSDRLEKLLAQETSRGLVQCSSQRRATFRALALSTHQTLADCESTKPRRAALPTDNAGPKQAQGIAASQTIPCQQTLVSAPAQAQSQHARNAASTYNLKLHDSWGVLSTLQARLEELDAQTKKIRQAGLKAEQRRALDSQVAEAEARRCQAVAEKEREAAAIGAAAAAYAQEQRNAGAVEREKHLLAKADREAQVAADRQARRRLKERQLKEELAELAAIHRAEQEEQERKHQQLVESQLAMERDRLENAERIRLRKDMEVQQAVKDHQLMLEYQQLLAAQEQAREAALKATYARRTARAARVGEQVEAEARKRAEWEDKRVTLAHEQAEAKVAAEAAVAAAKRAKMMDDIEQARLLQQAIKAERELFMQVMSDSGGTLSIKFGSKSRSACIKTWA
ncbi:hypothetical protein WJX72_004670 [[Myrmecia] bisecta]|uniref:serine O-acetyltransferase n=1 Tax=[Myrmecia] bisecta TaxID=41462 RepID=A0AAW1QR63_9CHLO